MIQAAWRGFYSAFLANPNAQRDYRAQMRGTKAATLWGLYLGLVILLASVFYGTAVDLGSQGTSISALQTSLKGFFAFIMGMLDVAVFLTAPILTASLVVAEYDRRAIDLVLSSPMKPSVFLLGKLISAWRNVWMMLLLSLPVASVCIVLGGATWSEVLESYWLLSMRGLVFASIALPIATITKKVVPAAFWSLLACGTLQAIFGFILFSSPGVVGSIAGMGPSTPLPLPWSAGLTCFSNVYFAGREAAILSWTLPGFLPPTLAALFGSALAILGGSACLSRYGSPASIWLRVLGLAGVACLSYMLASQSAFSMWSTGMSGSPMPFMLTVVGFPFSLLTVVFLAFVCHISAFVWWGERKEAPGPLVDFKGAFLGGPGGALPYVFLFWLAIFLPALFAAASFLMFGGSALPPTPAPSFPGTGPSYDPVIHLILGALWYLVFYFMCVGAYRLVSATAKPGTTGARRSGTALLLAICLLPLPLVLIAWGSGQSNQALFALVPLAGPFLTETPVLGVNAFVIGLLALVIFTISESVRKTTERTMQS